MIKTFIEIRVMTYLMMLKITPNLKGYTYFKECIIRLLEDGKLRHKMSKGLFIEMANRFNDKPHLFDRALRHAVDVSYKRNGIRCLERKIKLEFSNDKPSAKEILCYLAEKIKIDVYQKYNYII